MVQQRKLFDMIKIRSLVVRKTEKTTTTTTTTTKNDDNDNSTVATTIVQEEQQQKKEMIILEEGTSTEKMKLMKPMNPNLSKRDALRISKIQKKIELHESRKDFRKSNTLRKSIAAIQQEAAEVMAAVASSSSDEETTTTTTAASNPNLSRTDIRRISRIQKRIDLHESKNEFRKSNKLRKSIAAIEQEANDAAKTYELMAWADRSFMGLQ